MVVHQTLSKNSKSVPNGKLKPSAYFNTKSSVSILREPDQRERPEEATARIDKLDGFFFEPVKVAEILARAKYLGLECKFTRLRGSKGEHGLRIGDVDGEHVTLKLYRPDRPETRTLLTNPSHFSSFKSYKSFIINLFGLNQWDCFRIYRIDFAVDIPESFEDAKQWIRVRRKQIHRADTTRGSKKTGITLGKGDEQFCIYDKTEEEDSKQGKKKDTNFKVKGSQRRTRIEARFTGKKKLVERLNDLPKILGLDNNGRPFRPFEKLDATKVQCIARHQVSDPKKRDKLVEFETLVKHNGIHYAIKALNENRNFKRDMKGLYTLEDCLLDLNGVLRRHLETFFEREVRHAYL